MDGVIDLTDGGDHDVLVRTEASGLLRGGQLASEPLAEYLVPSEAVRYVCSNAKRGVTVEREGVARTVEPGDAYRAFVLLTDRRLLFVIGDADGDWTETVDLSAVRDATVERTGLLVSELQVSTESGQTWRFPCRDGLAAVAERIREDAQTWGTAERLLEDAAAAEAEIRDALDGDDYGRAIELVEDAEATVELATEEIERVGDGAAAALAPRADELYETFGEFRHEIIDWQTPADDERPEAGGTDAASQDGAADEPPTDPDDSSGPGTEHVGADESGATGPDVTIDEALAALDQAELAELVADVWAARGWSTTRFSSDTAAHYDVLAIHEGADERLLLWARAPGTVDTAVVERCGATLDRSEGADRATVVTTGDPPSAVRQRAEAVGVTIVDRDALGDMVAGTGLEAGLLDAA